MYKLASNIFQKLKLTDLNFQEYSIESKTENGFYKIVLRNNISQTFVEIIPSCGAILHAFTIFHNNNFVNVIDSYGSAAEFENNGVTNGFKACKMSPFACRLKNATYTFGEVEYTVNKFLLGESAIHGLLYDAEFKIISQHTDNEMASIVLLHQYLGTEKGYPFKYDCTITYQLKSEHTLTIITEITNRDKGLIPMQDGWHPYFKLGENINDLQLEFQSTVKHLFDELMIPTGETIPYQEYGSLKKIGDKFFDDCFSVNFAECQPMVVLRDASQKLQVEIYPEKTYPYLQIYTPAERKSIAIENLSALPNSFNNGIGLITLTPQANTFFTTTYKITPLG